LPREQDPRKNDNAKEHSERLKSSSQLTVADYHSAADQTISKQEEADDDSSGGSNWADVAASFCATGLHF